MEDGRSLLDGTKPNEAKVESTRRFHGPTDAARIYVETFAESTSMSRTARDVLKALAQIMAHGNGFWYACPRAHEIRLMKSCLRLTDKDYDSAMGEIWELKCIRKSNDGKGIRMDDEYMMTVDGENVLERFAISRRNDGSLNVSAAFVSYDD
jgi:hypothetical protein